jgi:deoxyribonuclease IV
MEAARSRLRTATRRIGFHAPISGGLHQALITSHSLACTTVQIFSRNPRGWAAKPLTDEDVALFRNTRAELDISPVVIHCNYLINLASADANLREKSFVAFREEIERGILLGADYLVLHPGSAKGSCAADAIATCAQGLIAACAGLQLGKLQILLENTAGQGECIGHRFEQLKEIIELCPELNLGVCLDTAHAFTAGYQIRDSAGMAEMFDALEENISAERVKVVHFNDSRAPYNSRVDRHWHIGLGEIGGTALRRIANHPALKGAAFILETPYDTPKDNLPNINALRGFVGQKKVSVAL